MSNKIGHKHKIVRSFRNNYVTCHYKKNYVQFMTLSAISLTNFCCPFIQPPYRGVESKYLSTSLKGTNMYKDVTWPVWKSRPNACRIWSPTDNPLDCSACYPPSITGSALCALKLACNYRSTYFLYIKPPLAYMPYSSLPSTQTLAFACRIANKVIDKADNMQSQYWSVIIEQLFTLRDFWQ